jgi:Spy/CpxP family protein refolding chaperone
MKNTLVRSVAVASMAITIAAAHAPVSRQQDTMHNVEFGGGIGFSAGGMNRLTMLTSMLALNTNQQEQIKAILDEEDASSKPLMDQLKQASDTLVSAQKAGAPDAEIDHLARNLANISGEILALDAKAQSKVYSQLTAEQKQRLEQLPHPFFAPSAPLLPPGPVFMSTFGAHGPK